MLVCAGRLKLTGVAAGGDGGAGGDAGRSDTTLVGSEVIDGREKGDILVETFLGGSCKSIGSFGGGAGRSMGSFLGGAGRRIGVPLFCGSGGGMDIRFFSGEGVGGAGGAAASGGGGGGEAPPGRRGVGGGGGAGSSSGGVGGRSDGGGGGKRGGLGTVGTDDVGKAIFIGVLVFVCLGSSFDP